MFGEYRGIPREARYLIYLSFIPFLAFGFIYTDLSFFLTKTRGFSDLFMGYVIASIGVSVVATSIPLGMLADRYGRRKFVILGNILASSTLIFFALTVNPILLILVGVVEGIGESCFAAGSGALLAEKAGDEKRTVAYSLSGFLTFIAGALGGFAISAVSLFESFGLNSLESHIVLYVIVGLVSLATTPLFLKIHETMRVHRRELLPRRSAGVIARYAVTNVAIAAGAGLFVPLMARWFSLFYGIGDTISGPILGVSGLATALAILIAPTLARRLGIVRAIVLTQGLSTLFMVMVPLSPNYAVAGVVYTIRAFMMNCSGPLAQSVIIGLVAVEERGAASGFGAALWRFPNALSTSIGAGLMGAGFLVLPFYIATVLYVFAITTFWVFFKDAKLPEESKPSHWPMSTKAQRPLEPPQNRRSDDSYLNCRNQPNEETTHRRRDLSPSPE